MLWRDLAGRLEGLVTWIDRHRSPGGCVGRLGERIDPIIEELERLRQDAQDCGGDDSTDLRVFQGRAKTFIKEAMSSSDPYYVVKGVGRMNKASPTDQGAPPRRRDEEG